MRNAVLVACLLACSCRATAPAASPGPSRTASSADVLTVATFGGGEGNDIVVRRAGRAVQQLSLDGLALLDDAGRTHRIAHFDFDGDGESDLVVWPRASSSTSRVWLVFVFDRVTARYAPIPQMFSEAGARSLRSPSPVARVALLHRYDDEAEGAAFTTVLAIDDVPIRRAVATLPSVAGVERACQPVVR
jgi:hypothetical protein